MTGEAKAPPRKRTRLISFIKPPEKVQSGKKQMIMISYDARDLRKRACTVERIRGSYQGKETWYGEDRTSQEKADKIS